jgi:sulfopyruvate decarboxylase TPP-binding subunit
MHDHASSHRGGEHPEVEAIETIGQAVTDLVEVAERLPVRPDQTEEVARILDRLSEEISEAAAMLRQTT